MLRERCVRRPRPRHGSWHTAARTSWPPRAHARVSASRPRVPAGNACSMGRRDAVPVAARRTPAARLLHEDLLDQPAALADGLDGAPCAAVVRLRPDLAEPRPAMARPVPYDFGCSAAIPAHATGRNGFHLVVPQPVPDGPGAAIELAHDLADRHAALDQRLEILPPKRPRAARAAARGVRRARACSPNTRRSPAACRARARSARSIRPPPNVPPASACP